MYMVTWMLASVGMLNICRAGVIVDIPGQGKVLGSSNSYVQSWLGVPFAADTSGAARFLPPKARPSWDYVLDTTQYGAGCPSIHHNPDVPSNTSEDCLNINIYVPANRKQGELLPVGLFFYGGSFAEGSN